MNCYFEEGEVFTWVRDKDRQEDKLVLSLKMLRESYRNGNKQAMIKNRWKQACLLLPKGDF